MAFLYTLTPMPSSKATSRSTSTPCASPHANCGASKPRRAIQYTSTYGMTTLSQPKSVPDSASLAALPRLPRDEGGPVFAEPWQAFALAVKLSDQGHFTCKEWAAALAGELKRAADRGRPGDRAHYYDHC